MSAGLGGMPPPTSQVCAAFDSNLKGSVASGVISMEQSKEAQHRRHRAWLKRRASGDGGWRVAKRRRVAAKTWLDNLDSQVQTSLGLRGLVDFVPNPDDPLWNSWRSWRHLLVSIDQGSDGLAATNFMKHMGMNVSIACDYSHGANNDFLDCIKDLGLQPYWLLLLLCFNVEHGPWGEDARWNQMVECFDELRRYGSPKQCALFQAYAPFMLEELESYPGFSIESGEDPEAKLWEFIMEEDPLRKKGTKVQLARFQDARDKAGSYLCLWTVKRFVYEYCALETGMMNTKVVAPLKIQGSRGLAQDDEKATTDPSRMNTTEKALRNSCANSLVIACMVLEEEWHRRLCVLIVLCSDPVSKWHSKQNHELRSASGAALWLADQVSGSFHDHVKEILSVATDQRALSAMGFCLTDASVASADNGWMAQEADLAQMCGGFLLTLAFRREARCLWLTRGWPSRMGALMGSSAAASETLKAFQKDLLAFEALGNMRAKSKAQEKLFSRSVFHETSVKQYVQARSGHSFLVGLGEACVARYIWLIWQAASVRGTEGPCVLCMFWTVGYPCADTAYPHDAMAFASRKLPWLRRSPCVYVTLARRPRRSSGTHRTPSWCRSRSARWWASCQHRHAKTHSTT